MNMNFEVEDYRKHKPEDIGQWPFWIVPRRYVGTYIWKAVFILYFIPVLLFGTWFLTLSGFFLYFLLYDVLEYINIKKRINDGQ